MEFRAANVTDMHLIPVQHKDVVQQGDRCYLTSTQLWYTLGSDARTWLPDQTYEADSYPACHYVVKSPSTWNPAATSAADLDGCTTLAAGERVLCPSGANVGIHVASSATVCGADPSFVVREGYTVRCVRSAGSPMYRQTAASGTAVFRWARGGITETDDTDASAPPPYLLHEDTEWSPWDEPAITCWLEADDAPVGRVAEWTDHRNALALGFTTEPLVPDDYRSATQATSGLQPICATTWRGEKWVEFDNVSSTADAPRYLSLPAAVAAAFNGASLQDCTVIALCRIPQPVLNTARSAVDYQVVFGCNNATALLPMFIGRGYALADQLTQAWASWYSEWAYLYRQGPRSNIWGAAKPFRDLGNYAGTNNTSVIAGTYSAAKIGIYANGMYTECDAPVGLSTVDFTAAYLGHPTYNFYGAIRSFIVIPRKLSLAELRKAEEYFRRGHHRKVIWIGGSWCTNTADNVTTLSPAGAENHRAFPWYSERAMSARYSHVNHGGNPRAPADELLVWENETERLIKPGDVVVVWSHDGGIDAFYDPANPDRAPEIIDQLKELCRRIKAHRGIPIVPTIPPWGSFFEGGWAPHWKLAHLKTVNDYLLAHPTEFSYSADGIPDCAAIPELQNGDTNNTYFGGGGNELLKDIGHQLIAPVIARAIELSAPVGSVKTAPVVIYGEKYPNQGSYVTYLDETTIPASGTTANWTAREGLSLTRIAGGNIAIATDFPGAYGDARCLSVVDQDLQVTDSAIGAAFNGNDANIALALEIAVTTTTSGKRLCNVLGAAHRALDLYTDGVTGANLKIKVGRWDGTNGPDLAAQFAQGTSQIFGVCMIAGVMYVCNADGAQLSPIAQGSLAATGSITVTAFTLFTGFNGLFGTVKVRRAALWKPTALTELQQLIGFWSAKP